MSTSLMITNFRYSDESESEEEDFSPEELSVEEKRVLHQLFEEGAHYVDELNERIEEIKEENRALRVRNELLIAAIEQFYSYQYPVREFPGPVVELTEGGILEAWFKHNRGDGYLRRAVGKKIKKAGRKVRRFFS